jgi:hypothetical protein
MFQNVGLKEKIYYYHRVFVVGFAFSAIESLLDFHGSLWFQYIGGFKLVSIFVFSDLFDTITDKFHLFGIKIIDILIRILLKFQCGALLLTIGHLLANQIDEDRCVLFISNASNFTYYNILYFFLKFFAPDITLLKIIFFWD